MFYTKKSKCSGCIALEKADNGYKCRCFVPIEFNIVGDDITSPKPLSKCYKPETEEALIRAEKLLKRRRG